MKIKEDIQYSYDMPWFAVDDEGLVSIFWSGGMALPASVASSWEDYAFLLRYFGSVPFANGRFDFVPEVIEVDARGQDMELFDMGMFFHFAHRGFFEFDLLYNHLGVVENFLKTRTPSRFVTAAQLPAPVVALLCRTRFQGRFGAVEMIGIEEIG